MKSARERAHRRAGAGGRCPPPRRTIRTGRSRWSCRSRPAAAPTIVGAHRRRQDERALGPADHHRQPRRRGRHHRHAARSRRPRPTATRSCSAIPARWPSIRASTPTPATTRARISRRSAGSAPRRTCWSCIPRCRPIDRRTDRLCQGQSRQAQLRLGRRRHGHPVCGEFFATAAGVEDHAHSLQGHRPAITDLLGGHIPMAFAPVPATHENAKTGKLRMLAVTSAVRSTLLPDVPTIAEAALPGFEAVLRYGLVAPTGTPRADYRQGQRGAQQRARKRRRAGAARDRRRRAAARRRANTPPTSTARRPSGRRW